MILQDERSCSEHPQPGKSEGAGVCNLCDCSACWRVVSYIKSLSYLCMYYSLAGGWGGILF